MTLRMRARPLPVAVAWTVRIERGARAAHRQRRRALPSPLVTEHIFRALGPDRTLLTDRVTYRLRGGRFGALAGPLVGRRLKAAFAERHRHTRELLEA